jgi:hypothetical protein
MALTTSTARARVKDFVDVPTATTTFDDDIDKYVLSAVDQLAPRALNEADLDETIELATDENSAGLPTDVVAIRRLELYNDAISGYQPSSDFMVHGETLYLDTPVATATTVRLWPLKRYILTTVPAELELAVLYWAVAQFYASLAGNRRKYNSYTSQGATADRDVKDSADFFQALGDKIFDQQVQIRSG